MIPDSIEDIVDKQERSQKKHRILKVSAVGTGLAVAISMFALKHDINKVYFNLSNRIDTLEQQAPPTPHPTQPTYHVQGSQAYQQSPPVNITITLGEGYVLTDACTTERNGVYEVRPC